MKPDWSGVAITLFCVSSVAALVYIVTLVVTSASKPVSPALVPAECKACMECLVCEATFGRGEVQVAKCRPCKEAEAR